MEQTEPKEVQEAQVQQEEVQEEAALTIELVNDLVELLANNSTEVRHGTISAVLQYTPTTEAKLMFKDTPLIQYLRKYLFEPKLTKICLSTLIHFATEGEFMPEFFKLIEPLVLKMKDWGDYELELELGLLLLLNISKEEEIVVYLLGQEEDKKGYLMEILYALLENKEKMRWIIVGVFVNVAAIERGRRFLVEEGMGVRFVKFVNSFDVKLREASLKIVRNCAFEWEYEPFVVELFKPEHNFFQKMVKFLVFMIYKQNLIHDLTHTKLLMRKLFHENEISFWEVNFHTSDKVKTLEEVELGIDILLILSNCGFKEREIDFNVDQFMELLTLLKFTEIKEETKDKLEALEIFGL